MPFLLNNDFVRRHLTPDLRNTRVAPFLVGPPAIGKTSAVAGLAGTNDFGKVFSIEVNTLSDAADLTGVRTIADPEKPGRFIQVFFPHQVIQRANDYALENPDELVIIMLDEINRTTSDVTSAALTLLTTRRCGNLDLADNIRFIITGNDKGNITMLDTASVSRFAMYPVRPDAHVLMEILGDKTNPAIRKVLTARPDLIMSNPIPKTMVASSGDDDDDEDDPSANKFSAFAASLEDAQDMAQFAAPRTIEGLNHWLNEVGDDELRSMADEDAIDENGVESTELMLALRAHTGDTVFTTMVNEELTKALLSGAVAAPAAPTIPMPSGWTDLRKASNRTEIEKALTALSTEEREATLLYALVARNETDLVQNVLNILIDNDLLTSLSVASNKVLVGEGIGGRLESKSVRYLLGKKGDLVNQLSAVSHLLGS